MNRTNRISRSFKIECTAVENEINEMWVEGYAARFNSETVLFEIDGVEYKEIIDPSAFTGCNMTDVIFNYNHSGKVMARTRNNTLMLEITSIGLLVRARLDGTEEGRKMYDEIKGGYVDRMSFQFIIGDEVYDKDYHTWRIVRIKRLYDVSAVDIPAYDDTSIEARKNSILEANAQEMRKHQAEAELLRMKMELKLKL